MHIFQDLQQSPTLAAIAFGGEGPFAFEINIINQGVAALCGRCDALELSLQIFAIAGLGEPCSAAEPWSAAERSPAADSCSARGGC